VPEAEVKFSVAGETIEDLHQALIKPNRGEKELSANTTIQAID
jgi:hypothetical protein